MSITQPRACVYVKRSKNCVLFRSLQPCWSCQLGNPDHCSFKDFRTVEVLPGSTTSIISFRREQARALVRWRLLFNRRFLPPEYNRKLTAIASILHPLLSQEVLHRERRDLVQLGWPLGERVNCDLCATFLFCQAWLCGNCGRDICDACYGELHEESLCSMVPGIGRRHHQKADLRPVSRFSERELQESLAVMAEVLAVDPVPPTTDTTSGVADEVTKTVYRCSADIFSFEDFIARFSRGEPVIVTNVNLEGPWKPQNFIDLYGDEIVKLVDTETQEESQRSLSEFFAEFGARHPQGRSLKLKDWPPSENFKDRFPQHHESFQRSVPFPDLTRPDGVLNIAAHFPENVISPDLGPKMYNAFGTSEDDFHHGSTRLHKDVTDAVNIMAHASVLPDGTPGGARWVIFHRDDARKVSRFLMDSTGDEAPGDPIHSQRFYLTQRDLQNLQEQHHVTPYIFNQCSGDAVFIPAGSPHQVSNYSDSIKVAYDFISVENLSTTLSLAKEYRLERLVNEGDDVLQIYKTLWDAWICLTKYRGDIVVPETDCAMEDSITEVADIMAQSASSTISDTAADAMPVVVPCGGKRAARNLAKRRALKRKRTANTDPSTLFLCPVYRAAGNSSIVCPHKGGPYDQNGTICHIGDRHSNFLQLDDNRKAMLKSLEKESFLLEYDRLVMEAKQWLEKHLPL